LDRSPSPLNTALGWRLPEWLLDFGPPAFVLFEGTVAVLVRSHRPDRLVLWLAVLVNAVALRYRRRAPLPVLGVVLAITLGFDYGPIVVLPTMISVFTVAEYCKREQVFAAGALAATVLMIAPSVHGNHEAARGLLADLAAVGFAVAAGLYLRARADYIGGLQDRAARLEREHELLARHAAGEERVRIARELHDVVAHNVSLMVVQAQALAATSGGDAEQRAALGRLANLGRDALSEMHRMLGVLRLDAAGDAEREPQPGVGELGKLVAQTAESGLDVSLAVQGEPRELSSAINLSAYRIVQEALTNVIRHAAAQHVDVELSYTPRELNVTVTDDGRGVQPAPANGSAGGHGLVGMRERVALFGGTLEAGAGAGGRGYRVRASLPTG
jgi:signal transduction histidine kinase